MVKTLIVDEAPIKKITQNPPVTFEAADLVSLGPRHHSLLQPLYGNHRVHLSGRSGCMQLGTGLLEGEMIGDF
jgi:hypothetical protein